jgi:hypothetical protein
MDEQSEQGMYEVDYTLEDPAFFQPFQVMKPLQEGRPAWWSDRTKVLKLIEAFKMDLTINEASIYVGITVKQYQYFCQIHPIFVDLKARLKGILAIAAKQGLVRDISGKDNYRSRQWYLERKQPRLYGNKQAEGLNAPDGATTLATIVQRAFADKDGNILVTESSANI